MPQELIRSARGGEVDINIEDNRNDEYVARAPKLVAFSGEGHKLGRYALLFPLLLFSVLILVHFTTQLSKEKECFAVFLPGYTLVYGVRFCTFHFPDKNDDDNSVSF